MLKPYPTYAGMTPKFWGSCDAIGDKDAWVAWGARRTRQGHAFHADRALVPRRVAVAVPAAIRRRRWC